MAVFSGSRLVQQDLRLNIDLANTKVDVENKRDLIGNISLSELNGVSVTTDNLGEWVFDGIDDIVTLGNPASLNLLDEETTIAWIYPYNIDANRRSRIGNRHGGFLTTADSRFGYEGNNGSVWTNNLYTGSGTLKLNVWQQLAFTFKRDDRVDLYYNSTYITGKAVVGGMVSSTHSFVIGSENPGGHGTPPYFVGKIGVVQVYSRKLTAAEIRQNFEATRSRYGI
jgi:hypothetical protein